MALLALFLRVFGYLMPLKGFSYQIKPYAFWSAMKNTRPLQPDLVDFVRENPAANASELPGTMQKVEYSSLLPFGMSPLESHSDNAATKMRQCLQS